MSFEAAITYLLYNNPGTNAINYSHQFLSTICLGLVQVDAQSLRRQSVQSEEEGGVSTRSREP